LFSNANYKANPTIFQPLLKKEGPKGKNNKNTFVAKFS